MIVKIINEYGYLNALYGIGLSYGLTSDKISLSDEDHDLIQKLDKVAIKLAPKGDGHNKFLEFIDVYVTINAPRYWWSEFDTYRVGVTKQSESTMHTILKIPFSQDMFQCLPCDEEIPRFVIDRLNLLRANKNWRQLKIELPESFLQKRIVKFSYMNIQNIINQRITHRLVEWKIFIKYLMDNLSHSYLLSQIKE